MFKLCFQAVLPKKEEAKINLWPIEKEIQRHFNSIVNISKESDFFILSFSNYLGAKKFANQTNATLDNIWTVRISQDGLQAIAAKMGIGADEFNKLVQGIPSQENTAARSR